MLSKHALTRLMAYLNEGIIYIVVQDFVVIQACQILVMWQNSYGSFGCGSPFMSKQDDWWDPS